MSTLNEIAANHARMAKAKEEASIRLSGLHEQLVGGFEVPAIEVKRDRSLHFIAAVHEPVFAEGIGCMA